MSWQADSIVGVIFVAPQTKQEDAGAYWEFLFPGNLPSTVNRNVPNLQSFATGTVDSYNFGLSVQVGRIDLAASTATPFTQENRAPRISDIAGAVGVVRDHLKRLAPRVAAIRLALVPDLSRTVLPGEEYTELRSELNLLPLPAVGSDLTFGLNVRMNDGVVPLNRLLNWSSGQLGYLATPMVPGIPVPATSVTLTPFVGLKIDVNTIAEATFEAENVDKILDEMSDEVIALASQGVARLLT